MPMHEVHVRRWWIPAAVVGFLSLGLLAGTIVAGFTIGRQNDQNFEHALQAIEATRHSSRQQSCRVMYRVFKEQRTQIVQGYTLLTTTSILPISPENLRFVRELNQERLRRISNKRLPAYCGPKWRTRADTTYHSRLVKQTKEAARQGRLVPLGAAVTPKSVVPKSPKRPKRPAAPAHPAPAPAPQAPAPSLPPSQPPARPGNGPPARVCTPGIGPLPPICI